MKVICNFNDPLNLPFEYPNDFDYGLEIGKEYIVMGIVLYKNSNNMYYLVDSNGRPNWFPYQIFKISENSLPEDWFINVQYKKENSDIYSIWGFSELCNNEEYYDLLMDRDKSALNIYFKYKKSYESNAL